MAYSFPSSAALFEQEQQHILGAEIVAICLLQHKRQSSEPEEIDLRHDLPSSLKPLNRDKKLKSKRLSHENLKQKRQDARMKNEQLRQNALRIAFLDHETIQARDRAMREALRLGFPGEVVIENRESALAYALQEYSISLPPESNRITFWVDGSVRVGSAKPLPGAAAVVCKQHRNCVQWAEKAYVTDQEVVIDDVEMTAIGEVLVVAFSECYSNARRAMDNIAKSTTVVIYSDSLISLHRIRKVHGRSQGGLSTRLIGKIIIWTHALRQLGVEIVLRWVPGHSKVPGNLQADSVARRATRGRGSRKQLRRKGKML